MVGVKVPESTPNVLAVPRDGVVTASVATGTARLKTKEITTADIIEFLLNLKFFICFIYQQMDASPRTKYHVSL
jgi:hypothetical protein